MEAMDRRGAGAVIKGLLINVHAQTKCIHSRVEQFLGFFLVRQKKKNLRKAVRFFSWTVLGWAVQNFFVSLFVFFASPHSANHAVVVVS